MEMLVTAKFSENESLKRRLIKTGNKQLHEATKHPKWGTGAGLSSKQLSQGNWLGQDLLGKILERVRDKLIASSPIDPHVSIAGSSTDSEEQEIVLQPMTSQTVG